MKIVLVYNGIIPVIKYGGTERVIWYLGKELAQMGHKVSYLVKKGSKCDFGEIIQIEEEKKIEELIPNDADLVHFHSNTPEDLDLHCPYLVTIHGNRNDKRPFGRNAVFVSGNHASRFGSDSFVYNGLDWEDYSTPDLSVKREHFHFLANAAWRVKNVRGAIDVIKRTPEEKLRVLGGVRFNVKMGLRFTFSPRIRFHGMVGGNEKLNLVKKSKGILFPVLWHEPFGLAIIESLYFGCPVFATPYGSLPELVKEEVGFLSSDAKELSQAVLDTGKFSKKYCHEYAKENFNSKRMALAYLDKYETVMNGRDLNTKAPVLVKRQKEKFLPWN